MKEPFVTITAKEQNDTLYIVEYATGSAAKESTYNKVKRLICEDLKNAAKASAS